MKFTVKIVDVKLMPDLPGTGLTGCEVSYTVSSVGLFEFIKGTDYFEVEEVPEDYFCQQIADKIRKLMTAEIKPEISVGSSLMSSRNLCENN